MSNWARKAIRLPLFAAALTMALFAATAGCGTAHVAALSVPTKVLTAAPAADAAMQWPASSVIYTLYPEIFSPQGSFAGVTAQMPRLKALGVSDVWIMPVTPVGKPIPGHGAFDSPYCVHDYYGVNPAYGTEADLKTLIGDAHKRGMRVLLDEVLNHTAWDNALITRHPEFYVHSDGNPNNSASIQEAFSYPDVAQLDYANPGLRAYMTRMLRYWITTYDVDGFRFDSADTPSGSGRKIPAGFWQQLGADLRQTKPNILMLEEGQAPDLAHKPFVLDYAWRMYDPGGHGALKTAADGDASRVEPAWQGQAADFPAGMQHMSVQDDWDTPRDVNQFGGKAGAQAVAVFNFTNTGIPLLYNGMEIGNAAGVANPHVPIVWASGDQSFTRFYRSLIALRLTNPAFTAGTMTWLPNSAPKQLLSYSRSGGGSEFLVTINPTGTPASGKISVAVGSGWQAVPIAGIVSPAPASPLPTVTLPPHGFTVYRRPFLQAAYNAEMASVAALRKQAESAPGDDASRAAYSNGYSAGQNGGAGFLPFVVKTAGTSGTFVYSAAEAEGNKGTPAPETIDTGGKSFGLFAQSKNGAITITRGFVKPLTQKGDTFTLDFVSGFNEAGTVGVALSNANSSAGSFVFHGGAGVLFNDKPTGIGFVPGASHLVYTLQSPTTYTLTVTGADKFTGTGTVSGPVTGFQIQQTNSGGAKPDHNAYFNHLLLTYR